MREDHRIQDSLDPFGHGFTYRTCFYRLSASLLDGECIWGP